MKEHNIECSAEMTAKQKQAVEYLEKALEIGFTSIMYDGSVLPYEENLKNTKNKEMIRNFNRDFPPKVVKRVICSM